MTITLNEDYDVTLSTALLGYVGETNARPVTIEGMEVDGADRYVLTIDYGDGVQYEVDITGGQWTPTADILRSAQTISCQIAAKKLSGDEYVLVKKSRIFRLRIGAAIGDTAIPSPDVAVDALDRIDAIGRQAHADMQTAVNAAETATTAADNAAKSVTNAGVSADTAEQAASRAETAQTSAETSATQADTARQGAETARTEAVTAQNNAKISADLAASAAKQTTADKTATAGYAETAKTNADSTTADRQAVQEMSAQVTADKATVAENAAKVATDRKATENALSDFDQKLEDADEILTGVTDVKAYLGMIGAEDVLGISMDYKNKTCTRIAAAKNLTAGADFDNFKMYGGRKRCNVSDDGTINAYYGDAGYKEDGSNGQVMVYQPKFYYLVSPLEYDRQETGYGYHLRKANYYVSEKARTGFRLHPAFYDAAGNPVDYILLSAYEGSLWDADGGEGGTGAYIIDDAQVMNASADKFCSIAGAKPASGRTQNLTRLNIEQIAQNRGTGWHCDLIKVESANQLLMIVEMGMMNLQTAIGQGVVSISGNSAYNCSSLTGSTASLGNATGSAASTINEKGGAQTTETAAGKVAVTYRGMENPWGNIYKFVYGINFYGNGNMGGGQPFICNDFNFAESKNSGNYVGAGFTLTNANGYISAMGYSTGCDWLFLPSETLGNGSLPVGDYTYVSPNLDGYRIALLGGHWSYSDYAGGFYWSMDYNVKAHYRAIGGRLVYVPTATV